MPVKGEPLLTNGAEALKVGGDQPVKGGHLEVKEEERMEK